MTGGPETAFESARLRIAHLKLGDPRELEPALRRAVGISSRSLGVARVGIWMLSEDRRSLAPLCVIGRPEEGGAYVELPLSEWPAYAAAIDARRVISAHDAHTDPRTSELAHGYLVPLGIGALIDAPIFLDGEVWGIVCHEHEGGPRKWTEGEIDFAVSVADMLSTLFEHAARLTAERALRRRDEELARQRKNATLVQLGAGIGHDFGNVLQTISLLAERAAKVDPSEVGAPMDLIRDECERGQRLVVQLLDFARSTPRTPLSVDLVSLVRDLLSSLEALTGPKVKVHTTLTHEALVEGTLAQLERVVTNLVVNARDAMAGGGTVRIDVSVEGAEAVLRVADQGGGIPAESRDRVFEPFFTTRPGTGGTGLGLATVSLIVEQHHGTVTFESSANGTTFTVRLPLAPE